MGATETITKPAPVGELIDLGGYRLHLHSQGTGGPVVIMEAAIWDFSLTWSLVQPEVAKFTRARVYDPVRGVLFGEAFDGLGGFQRIGIEHEMVGIRLALSHAEGLKRDERLSDGSRLVLSGAEGMKSE